MKSKKLFRRYIASLLGAGVTQKTLARLLNLPNPNYVSMLNSDKYDTALLSLNRIERLAEVCRLTEAQVVRFALARVEDAGGNPVEMNADTFKFLLKTFAKLAIANHDAVVKTA